MNEQFNKAVTATAFNLALSRVQIEVLCAYAQGFDSTYHSTNVSTTNALARKGLIAARPYCVIKQGYIRSAAAPIRYERYVTVAGDLVIQLIKEAGLFVKYELGATNTDYTFNVGVMA